MSRLAINMFNMLRNKITSHQAGQAADLWVKCFGSGVSPQQQADFTEVFIKEVAGQVATDTVIDWQRHHAFLTKPWHSQPVLKGSVADRGGLADMLQQVGIDPTRALPLAHATMHFQSNGAVVHSASQQFLAEAGPSQQSPQSPEV
jgi:hypothetical protein